MSIFSKVKGFFKSLFAHEANWEKAASITLAVTAPLVQSLLTLTAGTSVGTAFGGIVAQVQTDLATVNKVITDAGPAPDAQKALNSILANLQQIETAVDIKDTTKQKAISLIVTTLTEEVEAVLAELPSATTLVKS